MRATASKNGCSNVAGAKIFGSEKPTFSSTKAHLRSQYLTQRQLPSVGIQVLVKQATCSVRIYISCSAISPSDSPSPRLGIPWVGSFTTQLFVHWSTAHWSSVYSPLNCSFTTQLFVHHSTVRSPLNCSFTTQLFAHYSTVRSPLNCSFTGQLFVHWSTVRLLVNCSLVKLSIHWSNCLFTGQLFVF